MIEAPRERHMIEVLRAGIPSRSVASTLGIGRQRLVEALHREMLETAQAQGVGGSVIKGEYGEGKTHLLNWLYQRAHEDKFAVSLISLSKETPFNRFDHIYRKIAEAIHLPGEPYRGVEHLLYRLGLEPEERLAITRFSEELHVKPRTVIRNYIESADSYDRYILLGDLEGASPLAAVDLRAINQRNKLGRVALARVSRQDYWDYLALMRFLIHLGGYAGWLVLVDEAEMIGLLGASSRAAAYGNVADLLGVSQTRQDSTLAGMHSVFSFASSFYSDILDRRRDLDEAPLRLSRRDMTHTPDQVKAVLGRLMEAHTLLPIDDAVVHEALEAIRAAHGQAYGWDPQIQWQDLLANTRDARLRTRIRAAIEYLDITYLYNRPPDLTYRPLTTDNIAEDEAFFTPGDAPPDDLSADGTSGSLSHLPQDTGADADDGGSFFWPAREQQIEPGSEELP